MIPLLLLAALGGLMHAAGTFSSQASAASTQLAFGYLLLSAYFTARIVNRFGLPKLTGYIIAGVLAGPYVFALVPADATKSLSIVSGTATAIIALEAGAELQLASVKRVLSTLRAMTLLAVIGAMVVLTGVIYVMRPWLPFLDGYGPNEALAVAAVLGVALSAQSPAVVMALLAEMRSAGPLSEIVLASVVVADLVVILVFSIVSAIAGAMIGGGGDLVGTALDVGWELFGSLAFGVAIGMVLDLFLRSVQGGASLFALVICVVVAEAGPRVHLDPLIVMLAAGLWLRNFARADASALMHGFESAQLPVFLVFFALAGNKLDVDTLIALIVPVVLLAGARAMSFFLGGTLACKLTRAPDTVTRYAWFGLVPQAGLALALALVIEKTFATSFGPAAAAIMFGVVGFNELVAPVILRAMLIKSGEAGKKRDIDFAPTGRAATVPPEH